MKAIETKSLVLLQHHLKALRLPTMHDECEKLATRCAQENVDHLAFLLQLCELELLDREKRSTQRRLRFARFPNYKTLDTFQFESQPSLNRLLVSELLRCQFIDARESVILIGHPGTGKTHIATALAIEACHRGYQVRFFVSVKETTSFSALIAWGGCPSAFFFPGPSHACSLSGQSRIVLA